MEEIVREYHPNGQLKSEIHYRGGKPHGPWRVWHPNGVLAEERFPQGVEGQWPKYSDGVSRAWHDNGQLASEVTHANGSVCGRIVAFDRCGKLVARTYLTDRGEASREVYDERCKMVPWLPRYSDSDPEYPKRRQRKQKVMVNPKLPKIDSAKCEEHRVFFEQLLAQNHAEAKAWLSVAAPESGRMVGELSPEEAKLLVEELYEAGALEVIAAEITQQTSDDHQCASALLVKLPEDSNVRARLFELEADHADSEGFDAETDVGQEYLFFKF